MHQAQVAVVAALGQVGGAAVVPHQHHPGAPVVAIDEGVLDHVLEQQAQDGVGLRLGQALDADRIDRADEQRLPTGDRVGADQGVGARRLGGLGRDDLQRPRRGLAGVGALGTVGPHRRVDRLQGRQHRLHCRRQRLVGSCAIAEQGVAADRRGDLRSQDGGRRRGVLEAPVGMPAGAEVRRCLVGLATQFQHVGAAGHRLDIGVVAERAHLQGEGLKRVEAQRLVGEGDDAVAGPGRLDLGQGLRRHRPGEVEAGDLRAEPRGLGTHADGAIGAVGVLEHGGSSWRLSPGARSYKHLFASVPASL